MRIGDLTRLSFSISRQLRQSSQRVESALSRLAGGVRPDSVSISQQSTIRSISRAIQNLNEANSFMTTRDQALGSLENILQQMRELSVRAQSTLLSTADRQQLTKEMLGLSQEYDRQVQSSQWNGFNLLDGSKSELSVQLDNSSLSLDLSSVALSETLTRSVGSMQFSELSPTANAGVFMRSMEVGDLDGDGDLDMVATDRGSGYVKAFFNDGDGQFTNVQTLNAGSFTNRPKLADLDGDGIQEIIFSQTTSSEVQIWKADGVGQYKLSSSFFAMASLHEPEIFDINGDGFLDIAFSSNSGVAPGWGIALNNGDGHFTVSTTTSTSSLVNGLSHGDYDEDGDEDLFVIENARINYFTNDGSGNFTRTQSAAWAGTAQQSRSADLNGDGHMDMVFTDYDGNGFISWMGDGSGNFSIVSSAGPAGLSLFSLGDLNGDGILDAVASDADSSIPYVYLGLATGGFSQSQAVSGSSEAYGSAIGDFDGDGVADFASLNASHVRIFKGLGTSISARSHLTLATTRDAEIAKESIDHALASILEERSKMASFQSRLGFVESELSSRRLVLEEQNSSEDTAKDLMEVVQEQIKQQAQMAALSQSFINAQSILKLLPGS